MNKHLEKLSNTELISNNQNKKTTKSYQLKNSSLELQETTFQKSENQQINDLEKFFAKEPENPCEFARKFQIKPERLSSCIVFARNQGIDIFPALEIIYHENVDTKAIEGLLDSLEQENSKNKLNFPNVFKTFAQNNNIQSKKILDALKPVQVLNTTDACQTLVSLFSEEDFKIVDFKYKDKIFKNVLFLKTNSQIRHEIETKYDNFLIKILKNYNCNSIFYIEKAEIIDEFDEEQWTIYSFNINTQLFGLGYYFENNLEKIKTAFLDSVETI